MNTLQTAQEALEDSDDDDESDRLIPALSRRQTSDSAPPDYSPLDALTYADGVHIDLPADVIQSALEGGGIPQSAIGQRNVYSRRR